MTKNEAEKLKTDTVIFSIESVPDSLKTKVAEQQKDKLIIEKQPVKANIENRYARLKKSLRKRSASIL